MVLLALVLIGLAATVALSGFSGMLDQIALDKPPAVLIDRAAHILSEAGYPRPPRDRLYGFATDGDFYRYVQQQAGAENPWHELAAAHPGPVYFWYQQSPKLLVSNAVPAPVQLEPNQNVPPGEVHLRLTPQGQLRQLTIAPPAFLSTAESAPAPAAATSAAIGASSGPSAEAGATTRAPRPFTLDQAWRRLFRAAGLNMADYRPAPPEETPPVFADTRLAWQRAAPDTGPAAGDSRLTSGPLRVEAAAAGGKPVYFNTVYAWQQTDPASLLTIFNASNLYANIAIQAALKFLLLAAGVLLAWRNIASGRADRSGALKLITLFAFAGLAVWAINAHHVPDVVAEYLSFVRGLGYALFMATLVWACYLAIEPFVRRTWPQTLISWSRLLAGRFLDPVVGRHVLMGAAAGVGCAILLELENIIPGWLGLPTPLPVLLGRITGLTQSPLASILNILMGSILAGLLLLLLLVVARTLLRNRLAAGMVFVLIVTAATTRWLPYAYVAWVIEALVATVYLLLLIRLGLVAAISCLGYSIMLSEFPITTHLRLWYAANAVYALAFGAALAALACYTATRRRPADDL
jgi:serine/threonine-protein kinase